MRVMASGMSVRVGATAAAFTLSLALGAARPRFANDLL
jgi:hypothetical protein